MKPKEYKFLQYPRGANKGGVLDVKICPTISCSSWQNNCFLIEIYGLMEKIETTIKTSKIIEPMCSVHPNSHKLEFNPSTSIKPIAPALRATDYKAPHCVYMPTIAAMRGRDNDEKKVVQQLEVNDSGCSNTLTSVQKDNYLVIPEATKQEVVVNENWKSVVGNKQMNPFRGSIDGESPCITSACGAGGGMTPMITDADVEITKSKEFIEQMRGHEKMQYRIRKLTPRECYRLMGVDDADIDKIQAAGISNAQQYKMAGNSIVVDVLYYLFKQMFVESENNPKGQLTLF